MNVNLMVKLNFNAHTSMNFLIAKIINSAFRFLTPPTFEFCVLFNTLKTNHGQFCVARSVLYFEYQYFWIIIFNDLNRLTLSFSD